MWRQRIRKFERKRRIKINFKRLIISLTIFTLLIVGTVKLSKEVLAKNHKEENPDSNVEENIDKKIDENIDKQINTETNTETNAKTNTDEDIDIENKGDEKEDSNKKRDKTKKTYDYKEIFKNDLFLGDSITDSLSFYEIIEEPNVIAELGFTTRKSLSELDKIGKQNPENIFIMLGMNDMLNNGESDKFVKDYSNLIKEIRERLPDTNIYIQSILPVHPKVKEKKPLLTNENIGNFNKALIKFAKDENINYINLSPIIEEDKELLEPDGIHAKPDFYILWLNYLIENIK